MTRLAAEQRAAGVTGRPVRILNVLGMRAEESTDRAQMQPFGPDTRASNKTVRHVDRWLPIHSWTAEQVWAQPGGIAFDARFRDVRRWTHRYVSDVFVTAGPFS